MKATIEAAHAGDRDRGFSVVATEVRKLQELSKGSDEILTATSHMNKMTILVVDAVKKREAQ